MIIGVFGRKASVDGINNQSFRINSHNFTKKNKLLNVMHPVVVVKLIIYNLHYSFLTIL